MKLTFHKKMPFTKLSSKWHKAKRMSKEKEEELVRKVRVMFVFILEVESSITTNFGLITNINHVFKRHQNM